MADRKRKFEYKFLEVKPEYGQADTLLQALNMLGADGWYVISVNHGALHDDIGYARVWLAREIIKDD